jgi:hypothetical protein
VSPTGIISTKRLVDALNGLVSANRSTQALPEAWNSWTGMQVWPQIRNSTVFLLTQITALVHNVFHDADIVDWRVLVFLLTGPWPAASLASLLVMQEEYQALDPKDVGAISAKDFEKVDLLLFLFCDLTILQGASLV